MNPTNALIAALAAQNLTAGDPDGAETHQALLLARHAATVADTSTDAADWDLFAATLTRAYHRATDGLNTDVELEFSHIPATGDDTPELRAAVRELLARAADHYAFAADAPGRNPWRQLVWADVAHLLDDAARELR